jgi:LacI family transcriptional regulator
LIDNSIMFVSADRVDYRYPEVNFVTVENVESSRNAVNHLFKLGRKRVGTIAGSPSIIDSSDRITGYCKALEDQGIAYDENLVYAGDFVYQTGYEGAKVLMKHNIDAIFAQLDIMALGAIDAIEEAGLRVPEDISVIGFDDLPAPYKLTTNLTTVRQPIERKGYELAHLLVDLLQGKQTPPVHKFLPTELIIRDTCGGSPYSTS